MDELANEILQSSGVKPSQDETLSPMDQLEAWLDLPEASAATMTFDLDPVLLTTSMEDCAPLPDEAYQKLGDMLCAVWKPKDTKLHHINTLIDQHWDDPLEQADLYAAMDAVRATRMVRHWMDLNIQGSNSITNMDAAVPASEQQAEMETNEGNAETNEERFKGDNEHDTLSTKLLAVTTETDGHALQPLISALYYHIEQLPQLQTQIHLYSQSLTKPGALKTKAQASSTPTATNSMPSSTRTTGLDSQAAISRMGQYATVQRIRDRLLKQWDEHTTRLESIIGEWYESQPSNIRTQCRSHLGRVFASFLASSGAGGIRTENTTSSGVQITLRVLLRILKGMDRIDKRSCDHLLVNHLIPLHKPNSMVLWRDQVCLLELYHEPLVQCIATLLQKRPAWIQAVIAALLDTDIWPKSSSNTPKLVLLLHEVDTYIGIMSTDDGTFQRDALGTALVPLLTTLGRCMASEHSRLAERALTFFKNKSFQTLVELNFQQSIYILLPFLIRNEPSWNPTVRKMTYNVLKHFEDHDAEMFFSTCDRVFRNKVEDVRLANGDSTVHNTVGGAGISASPSSTNGTKKGRAVQMSTSDPNAPSVSDFSLKAGMGNWKPTALPKSSHTSQQLPKANLTPPPSKQFPKPPSRSGGGATPPLTVTGVAPWAINRQQQKLPGSSRAGVAASMPKGLGRTATKAPPLTVTGVAPWAIKRNASPLKQPRTDKAVCISSGNEASGHSNDDVSPSQRTGRDHVKDYMTKIKPLQEKNGSSPWAKAQMAESPTLLPNLKFHDLVFGHELGHGAFGSVKYARLINKTKTRSHWAEYAIKVVSTEKIKELGYERSVQREISVLRIFSHPGIARLISSFRFKEGVYLLLEYANGGDLHSLLRKNGSLDEESTRFVVGEIVAAISSIHELGFVFGDLKPENVVITETGHIKLTDFGGCRPITAEAKRKVASSSKNLLQDIRDGGWKSSFQKQTAAVSSSFQGNGKNDHDEDAGWGSGSANHNGDDADGHGDSIPKGEVATNEEEEEEEEDHRIEGTTAYLPPEVVLGGIPTLSADSWALGCVLFQCLAGRPPILEDDDEATKHRIVTFDSNFDTPHTPQHSLFGDEHSSSISSVAQKLILCLLHKIPSNRPGMPQVARDAFFEQVDVYDLHRQKPPVLDVGEVAPVPDAQWSRRQFSSIWAPQPKAYDIGTAPKQRQKHSLIPTHPIAEGGERGALFSTAILRCQNGEVRHISELLPLPS